MIAAIGRALANLSLMLRQPFASFCDIETAHDNALVTKQGDYVSWLRVDGMRRMSTRQDVERIALGQRIDLSGSLEERGHAIVGFYISDPEASGVQIEQANLGPCREVARQLGVELGDILDERRDLWPRVMRWEAAYFVLWTRKAVLTKEERRQVREEQAALARACPLVGESQKYFQRSEIMSARHDAFVSRVAAALRAGDIAVGEVAAHQALSIIRETIYRETAGSQWKATLPGDRVMPRIPDDETGAVNPGCMLWPSLRSQIFHLDAVTQGGQRVQVGDNVYAPVDMALGPEEPRSFIELSAALGADRIPWRCVAIIEGGGRTAMTMKEVGASFLSMFPQNNDLRRAFQALRDERAVNNHIAVKLRMSFATWAPVEDVRKLRRRASTLAQRIEGWGNCKATTISGDPLEGLMSSVPGLALASTGTPALALLGDALLMMPWNRTASPWASGAVLFRRPDGGIWPYDPSGGSKRPQVLDIFVAPPRSGKSVLANTINLGLCLSSAVLGANGARLPLIGKLDIGPSAEGFVRLLQEALGPARRNEAIFVTMQFAPGYEVNIFDTQLGCDYPLPLERAFLQNFLALATLPPDTSTPFEGMSQLIGLVIDEAYRLCTSVAGGSPKGYRPGTEPHVDAALAHHGIDLHREDPWWRDVVTALFERGEHDLAAVAQRHAMPLLEDLISAARAEQVQDVFAKLKINATHEDATKLFERYIYDVIKRYPTLNRPTRLDFGAARVIVMDLASVAPTGSAQSNRQTEMMYMLGRHVLARNFFLHPDYAQYVPEPMRAFHRARFQEVQEAVKRLDYDEWHRTQGSPQVRAQAELDAREGPKHNIQMGFASQRLSDMGDAIVSQSTGRFVLKAGDEREMAEIIDRFNLSEASAAVVRYGLNGPSDRGAPFLAILQVDDAKYEQMLVNQLGPRELWAFSTTPGDTGLRNRLYDGLGSSEALKRLARVFPAGSAQTEINRRKDARLRRGELDARAAIGVIDELAGELIDGRGLGIVLRDHPGEVTRPPANEPPARVRPAAVAAE
jgi:intracellular multiplication protein IcmB